MGVVSVSAQPEHYSRQVPAIPHSINAIGDALTGPRRAVFYRKVPAAEQGQELDEVTTRAWIEAMLDRDPHRAQGASLMPSQAGI